MKAFLFILTSMLLCLSTLSAAKAENFVVLELFTTRGCGNCPPVDARIKNIVDESNDTLIALGCHVSYFNRPEGLTKIGYFDPEVPDYSDPLAQPFCDGRQMEYVKSNIVNRVYTPQIVINGNYTTIGGAEDTITSALKMAQSLKPLETIPLSLENDVLDISLPAMPLTDPVNVWIFGYNEHYSADGAAGMEVGARIEYVNYVSHHAKLLRWDGSKKSMSFPLKDMKADGYAVIAQHENFTDIVAAGKVERAQN